MRCVFCLLFELNIITLKGVFKQLITTDTDTSNLACKNVLLLNLSIPSLYQMGVQPRLQQHLKTKEENINVIIYTFFNI